MATFSKQELEQLHPDRIPISKALCILKAAFQLLGCINGAGGDLNKIKECVDHFVAGVKAC